MQLVIFISKKLKLGILNNLINNGSEILHLVVRLYLESLTALVMKFRLLALILKVQANPQAGHGDLPIQMMVQHQQDANQFH